MRLLIVEDDGNKCQQLVNYIDCIFPETEIVVTRSFHSGLKTILTIDIDIVLLDMTMPTYDISPDEDGGRIQHYAGREILRQMSRKNICIPVIVVTQYDYFGEGQEKLTREQLDSQLSADYTNIYKGTIYYNPTIDNWKYDLFNRINATLQRGR